MIAVPDVTVELFELIMDSDDEVKCDIVKPEYGGCDRPARWAWRCSGCGHDNYACDTHRKEFDLHAKARGARAIGCNNGACDTWNPVPPPWRPI